MFIHRDNETLFQVMNNWDCSDEPEDRWKDLRSGVNYYNQLHGTAHEFTGELCRLYMTWILSVNQNMN